jgi:hypothetical protein
MAPSGVLDEMAPDTQARQQRPYFMIGLGLLALVSVIVAGALLLDRQLRPRLGIEPVAGTSESASGSPSRTISTESEINLLTVPLQREVAAGYLNYWKVYAAAVESLDASKLSDVTADERLEEAQAEVADLRAAGRAAKIQVRHSFSVLSATANEASLKDRYVNSSYAIDPTTKQPIGAPGQSQSTTVSYSLRRMDGRWKVVEAIREAA